MKKRLRILSVEDEPKDTELIRDLLETEDIASEMTRVDTEKAYRAAIEQGPIDLILADYSLPNFDGLSALKIARESCPDVPFIFVSGTLGEELAIEALKIGATDYVLKTRVGRLVPSMIRALRECGERVELRRSGEKLRRSEAYLAEAQQLSHTGSFGWNVSSGEMYWSEETFRIFGCEPSAKVTIDQVIQRTHPEDRRTVRQFMDRAAREAAEFDFEHRLLMPDGSVKDVQVVGRPSKEQGECLEFLGAITDISPRKRVEEALRRSENYLAEAQRLARTSSFVWEVASRNAVHLSDEWYRIHGFDPALGMPVWGQRIERVHPADRSQWLRTIEQAIQEERDYRMEFRIVLPDGAIKWLYTAGHPVFEAGGRLLQFAGTTTDITERKRTEETLRRSEGYLAAAQRLTRSGSWAHNVETGEAFWSQEMFRILGYDPGKIAPSLDLFLDRVHPDDRSMMEKSLETDADQAAHADSVTDYRVVLEDGTTKHIHSVARPVLNSLGEVIEVVGTSMDVTEQHEAKAALESAFEEIQALKDKLYKENIALREEIDRSSMFEEIVGESAALQAVLKHVVKVAPTDSTVLITGETGTGKELIARAIHKRSPRAARAFVSVNCAAIPPSLIASELFGHEKGAFTGATQRRLGRFELADGGTIFLDEIGELPLDIQIALLRVLQEREFERVGGSKVIHANVRVIAATNRDLQESVENGAFRSDLFYRLNVFPIEMPPLRERKEDIPLLVSYFIDRYASKAGKKIRAINRAALDRLTEYAWPGNIRELQNVVERSVIVCDTENFTVDEHWLSSGVDQKVQPERPLLRLPTAEEKKTIEAVLAETRGRVSGPLGAAQKLGIPATTLDSKIKTLRINKNRFKAT